jgi:hypothetical protein
MLVWYRSPYGSLLLTKFPMQRNGSYAARRASTEHVYETPSHGYSSRHRDSARVSGEGPTFHTNDFLPQTSVPMPPPPPPPPVDSKTARIPTDHSNHGAWSARSGAFTGEEKQTQPLSVMWLIVVRLSICFAPVCRRVLFLSPCRVIKTTVMRHQCGCRCDYQS